MGALHGITLLARFRAEGFAAFTATPSGFMNSLAPLIGIAMVAGLRPLLSGSPRLLVMHLLTTIVALLAPAAISHAIARMWGREAQWLRYAVAYNWCQLAVTLLSVLLILIFMVTGGQPESLIGAILGVLCYWLTLSWFMLWRGLGLSRWRATLALVVLNMASGALILGPRLLAASDAFERIPG
jgi:hypothetical protein